MKELWTKIKEALVSALPITLIVYGLALTPLFNFSNTELVTFTIGAILLVLGIGLFNMGADLAMTPMGTHVGSGLSKQRKLLLLLSVCFVLGMLITIAEPDLQVLAKQVGAVMNGRVLIYAVGIGVGAFLVVAIMKIVFKRSLSQILMLFYMLLFALGLMLVVQGNENLLPLAFDSGGVTTGPITVPFIMALGVGISSVLGDRRSKENSFGLVTRKAMITGLCIGVGSSIALSVIRIIFDFSIVYYIIPGYFISLALSLFVPPVYTAIAFDSGGVASGPMTSGFILPFATGVCVCLQGEAAVLRDAFGVVALVAMTPLITIQLLGFRSIIDRRMKEHRAMKRILDADDQQIINFM